jgi:uncharacterized protein YecE (DUF72 family)
MPKDISMKNQINTGCSSFNEMHWKGIFYPEDLPRSQYFDFYCQHFNTYELNSTFYKFPTVKSLKSWYDKAPENFKFAIKAPRIITHDKKLANCTDELIEFYATAKEGLGHKISCILFQMPPSFHYSEERLALIVDKLDYGFTNVIEFRHASWWRPDVYEVLAKNDITFCGVSYPDLPEDVIATTKTLYYRLHGNQRLFYSGYNDEQLEYLYNSIHEKPTEKAFVFFNNTAAKEGVLNALEFKDIDKN